MRKVAIIQARFNSSRLPGKVLKPLAGGDCSLQHIVTRLQKSKNIDRVILATTTSSADDALEQLSREIGIPCFRGDADDVLKRYYDAAVEYSSDLIIRITGDCPCVDAKVVDFVVDEHLSSGSDFSSNAACGEGIMGQRRTFPRGADVEVIQFSALKEAHLNACTKIEREHVTPYIFTHPSFFKLNNIKAPMQWYGPDIRITLDTKEDYILLCFIFDHLSPDFTTEEVIELFQQKPWLKMINEDIEYRPVIG